MTHLDDGILQAFLDDELPAGDRAEVAEHLLACEQCHASYEALTRANALFAQSVSVLDVEPPATRPAGGTLGSRARQGTASLVKAAVMVLVVAAVASAAVPGSPVRAWIASVVEPRERPQSPSERPAPPAETAAPTRAPAGISISGASGPAVLAVRRLEGSVIRLETVPGTRAGISVLGAERDPAFRTGAGRVAVEDGVGGEILVRLPLAGAGARLEVDGVLYAETRGGDLTLHVPADTADGEIVWR